MESFFWNGFGLRCVDAIRQVEPIICNGFSKTPFSELSLSDIHRIVPLKNKLREHLQSTPMFMPFFSELSVDQVVQENRERKSRYFVARNDDQVIAFMEIMGSGENFACESPGMMNICGAYMLPEYRGKEIFTGLLSHLMDVLLKEGFTKCGVDFESFNPTASGFWLKFFTPYTYSVVRRIDERILR